MPQKCTVCAHPKRRQIEADLAARQGSNRAIAGRYGLDRRAIDRHAAHHLPAALVKAEGLKDAVHAGRLYQDMKELVAAGKRVLAWAEDKQTEGRGRLALSAIRELRETFETLAKTAAALTAQQSSEALVDRQAVRESLKAKLRALVAQLDQAEATAPKCSQCGRPLPTVSSQPPPLPPPASPPPPGGPKH